MLLQTNIQSSLVRRSILLLVLLSSVTFLAGLGRPAIGDSDEAFYAEAGREMVESGNWITPYYNYEVRFQKPILYYWLVAGTYAVAGVGEAQARLWSALAGLGLALVTLVIGRRAYDEATGLLAGAIVATCFGYFSIGRLSLPDLPLAFFVTLTILATLAGTVDDDANASRWLLLAGFCMGCGFLTKGPLGVLLPALVVAPVWLIERQRLRLRAGPLIAASVVALVVGLPWYLVMAVVHGKAYIDSFFLGDNLERFATSRFNDPRPPWFYLPIIVGGMLPWTPVGIAAVPALTRAIRMRAGSREMWRMTIWAIAPLLFFTASIGKQPRYILPILPPLAVMLARVVMQRLRAQPGRDPWLQIPAGVVGLMLATMALLLYRAQPLVLMVPNVFVFAAIVAIALASVVAFASALAPRALVVPGAIAIAGALTLAGLQYGLSPGGRDPVQNMATTVTQYRTAGVPIATFRTFVRNLVFYTGVKQTDLRNDQQAIEYFRSPEPVLCVLDEGELHRLEQASGLRMRVLGEVVYFNASAVKLRTFLSPDSHRDLERVVLVTNR